MKDEEYVMCIQKKKKYKPLAKGSKLQRATTEKVEKKR